MRIIGLFWTKPMNKIFLSYSQSVRKDVDELTTDGAVWTLNSVGSRIVSRYKQMFPREATNRL